MEHNAIQWSGAPSCQRGSFAFYKSVSSKSRAGGPAQVWRLGEFYFVRCGADYPVSIAEVTLLWEDQTQRHLLASARLYFLPEDTPKGRTGEHGEDEVLAVSRKMVLRVEDLVRWSCVETPGWSGRPKAEPCGTPDRLHKPPQGSHVDADADVDVDADGRPAHCKPLKDKSENGACERARIKVLSYPQYCRYRSLQRRIHDGARDPALQDAHLLALGGVRTTPGARLMYCRDTFNHPTLESSVSFSWHFRGPSLSLRGRPRKRRGHDGTDSPTSGRSESWIEKMKENVMGSVEVGVDGWLPAPEEQLFLDELFAFMERQGSPIHKVPNLGFKKIDLFLMYSLVRRLGGYEKVTSERMWKVVYNELGGCPGSTSAATCTRRHYERLMLPYEEHLMAAGMQLQIPQCTLPVEGIRGRKPLPRGRKPAAKAKMAATPAPTMSAGSAVLVVKRGRGRPPGKRNKATLMAEAKLMAQQEAKVKAESPKALVAAPSGVGLTPNGSSTQQVSQPCAPLQPALLPVNMPLTPELSTPFLPKPKEPQDGAGQSAAAAPPGVLLSALPRHFVGGASPIKGLCPLDVLRNFHRAMESPALTPQDPSQPRTAIYTFQAKHGSPETPPPGRDQPPPPRPVQQHSQCSGCHADQDAQRGGARDARNRHPLPPLRVLPLDLDCSVQVRQLMRTRLGSPQFQSFTRRLSEALSQDLSAKPPIAPPPEQALPLNLSKRFALKRAAEPAQLAPAQLAHRAQYEPALKKAKADCSERGDDFGPGREAGAKSQEEPADLSSPSRIRAFLLGLPPFRVKLDEDLKSGKGPPSASKSPPSAGKAPPSSGSGMESQRTATVKKEAQAEITESAGLKSQSISKRVGKETEEVTEMDRLSEQMLASEEKCDVSKGHPGPVLPQAGALVLAQHS